MFDFKLDDIEDMGYDPIPKGVYPVAVEKAEVCDTKDGEGKYIKVELTVLGAEGEGFAGRKIFDNFNVINKSEVAVNIGKSNLKSLIIASGADIEVFTGPDQLIGLEMDAHVVVKTSTEYEDRNEVKKYTAEKADLEEGEEAPSHAPKGDNGEDTFD